MLKIIVVWALAALFFFNSLFITLRANFNAGTILMWVVSAMLVGYGIFHKTIDKFCAAGFGFALKVLFLTGAGIFAALFLFVAVSGYTNPARGDEKAVIVLGAGVRGEQVGNLLRRRLEAALDHWQKNPEALVVVTGGQGPQEAIPEALAMQRWLLEHGVPEKQILLEDKSTSTEENLTFARELLAEKDISAEEPVAVVTNAFHCYRASQYAKKLGFHQVRTIPATIAPSALLPSYMREVLALLYMWVFKRNLS